MRGTRHGDSGSRVERKQRTRAALLDAALRLMAQGRSFTSLGLREITREAGVVPTSFYRHFTDLDELGLALVEDGGLTLRRLLREARRADLPAKDMIRRSVEIYRDYVDGHRLQFLFITGERSGGSLAIRAAIRSEIDHFTHEIAQDLRGLGLFADLSSDSLRMICSLVVTTMLTAAVDFLDLPPDQARRESELIDNSVQQIRLIFLGAAHWRDA